MSRASSLATLRLVCTSGVDLMSQMPLLAECLRRLVPSFSLSMIRVDARCAPTAHYSEYFDEASHALFAASSDYFATRSEDPSAFANLMANPDPIGALVEAPPGYVEGGIYQNLFRRNGIHHTLDVALRDRRGPLAILGIFREQRTRGFDRRDVRVLRDVYEHLVHACAAAPSSARFDEHASAMVIVDRSGAMRWASARAHAWLLDATLGPDRARLVDAAQLPSLCRELCKRLDANRRRATAASAPAPRLSLTVPGGRLLLRAYTLSSEVDAGEDGYVGIQLALELDRKLRVLGVISRARLSPQLARLALAHAEGRTSAELLHLLDVSRTTLKSYQRDLYRRFDVENARSLVRRIETLAEGYHPDLQRHSPRRCADATIA